MRRLFVPEVIQTSAMDCGPATLKALLEGFGIGAAYGRLREACQTEVDGASIDALEDAALRLGLDAAQVMAPLDHLFHPKASNLPALIVVRQPNGSHHFVVAWRRHGSWLQVMDPGVGRRWVRQHRFLADVYEHTMPVDAELWNGFAGSEDFRRVLHARLGRLGAKATQLTAGLSGAQLARLDAACRMTEKLALADAVRRGAEAATMVARLARGNALIPPEYWTAAPIAGDEGSVSLRGAVLLRAFGRGQSPSAEPLSGELGAALKEKPERAWLALARTLASDGWLSALLLVLGLALAAAGALLETLVLRGIYDAVRELTRVGPRAAALGAAVALASILALMEFILAWGVLRAGRRLDVRLRLRFFHKIPRLADRYFRSRPASDMAERAHNVHLLRQAPETAALFLRNIFEMAFTVAAIAWLYPRAFGPALLTAAVSAGIPLLAQPALTERDLKLRNHAGALLRFNLDALLGTAAIHAHGAARVVRFEHNVLLGEWARAGFDLVRTVTWIEGLRAAASLGFAAWVVWIALAETTGIAAALLLVYWVLNLPALGQEAASAAWRYPLLRNTTLRLTEPLGAPEEDTASAAEPPRRTPVAIALENVTVLAGGHRILDGVSLGIAAGEHVAVVGRSGAGKSSLAGLLLGWHRPSAGRVLVDGQELDAAALDGLRTATAWADPQVHLWNDSLYDNLTYGNSSAAPTESTIADAQLERVLERLPAGMRTVLGENGGLVSGGEGQRVRLGRALARGGARLAILDEPARGLGREQRAAVLESALSRWRGATLLCVTHDVGDTLDFRRVIVMENGRIAEDGRPAVLAADPASLYRRMLDEENLVRRGMWGSSLWRRVTVAGGRVHEDAVSGRAGAIRS